MIRSTRIKLTIIFVLIAMFISLMFSTFIYQQVNSDLYARFMGMHDRMMRGMMPRWMMQVPAEYFLQNYLEARRRLLFSLGYTNLIILLLSSIAGYFLSGVALEPLEKAIREQRRFIADASHELKTPVTALRTMLEVALRKGEFSLDDARESLEEVKRLQSLTEELLVLSRLESNGTQIQLAAVNLAEPVSEALEMLRPLAEAKGIKLIDDIRDAQVKGDAGSLKKLAGILIDNAIKYTEPGGKVVVRVLPEKKGAVLEVSDTGIGMDRKDLKHIWDRFYRADTARSFGEDAGFGLGLSIARRIIELHRAKVTVQSTPGAGTTFKIKFS